MVAHSILPPVPFLAWTPKTPPSPGLPPFSQATPSVSFPGSSSSPLLLNIVVSQGPVLRSLCSTYSHYPADNLEACGFNTDAFRVRLLNKEKANRCSPQHVANLTLLYHQCFGDGQGNERKSWES